MVSFGNKKIVIAKIRSSNQLKEFLRCSQNPFYFILTYVSVLHPVKGIVPFNMYDFQISMLKQIIVNPFCVSLKPRQMGITTLLCAYILWLVLFNNNKNVLVISIKMTVAKSLLRKIKGMYQRLPEFLKVEVVNGNDSIGTSTSIILANGSEINVKAATTDAGRSDALSFLLLDEVAFQRNADDIWSSVQPTVSTGGGACLVSTAYGMGNLFHRIWSEAVEGLNGFFPIRLNWKMHPERDYLWYVTQSKLLGEKRTAQEIDCSFLASGYTVFDLIDIKVIEERLSNTLLLEERFGGNLKIYHRPNPKKKYVIGADVATGRARDYSAFSVMDLEGKEYACYKGKIDPRAYGKLLIEIGIMYNQACIAVEINAIGEGPVATLQENYYPNIYREVERVLQAGSNTPKESIRYGWYTSGRSRDLMISEMDSDLIIDAVELCNPFFVQEAKTFIYNTSGKAVALGKDLGRKADGMYQDDKGITYTDDSIIGACIANEVRKRVKSNYGHIVVVPRGGLD